MKLGTLYMHAQSHLPEVIKGVIQHVHARAFSLRCPDACRVWHWVLVSSRRFPRCFAWLVLLSFLHHHQPSIPLTRHLLTPETMGVDVGRMWWRHWPVIVIRRLLMLLVMMVVVGVVMPIDVEGVCRLSRVVAVVRVHPWRRHTRGRGSVVVDVAAVDEEAVVVGPGVAELGGGGAGGVQMRRVLVGLLRVGLARVLAVAGVLVLNSWRGSLRASKVPLDWNLVGVDDHLDSGLIFLSSKCSVYIYFFRYFWPSILWPSRLRKSQLCSYSPLKFRQKYLEKKRRKKKKKPKL